MLGIPITTGQAHFYISIMHCYFTSHFVLMQQALKYKELPSMFREQKHFSTLKLRTLNVTCPKLIPKKHLCFLLPIPLRTISYLWDNRSVSKYKLVRQNNMRKYLENHGQHKKITWYVNSKIRSSLFYDPRTNHIRYVPRYYYALPISLRDNPH